MSDPPVVSVVVPTHQRRASLLRLLEGLRKQTLPYEDFEVVVAIDGSDDGTREAVKEFAAPFALSAVYHANRGRAATVNAGVAGARGETIVILDDDMEPAPELLAAHLREHERVAHAGVVGAAPIRLDEATAPFTRYRGAHFNSAISEMATRPRAIAFAEAYTGNFSVRRTDFLEVGGFDATFDGYGLEDYELALRLTRAGVELVLAGDAIAYQHYDKTFPAAARDSESRGRSTAIFTTLHPSHAADLEGLPHPPRPSIARRLFRYALPRVTRVVPVLSRLVIRLVDIAERRRTRLLPFVYELGLEYFYLLGMREAARDQRLSARGSRW